MVISMRMAYLIIGSILALLFVIKLMGGGKYHKLLKDLDVGQYPLKSLYCAGFAWSNGKLLRLRGSLKDKLVEQSKMLYEPKYAEYYARVTWAQVITFVHLGLMGGLLLAAAFDSFFMLLIGIAVAVLFGYSSLNSGSDSLKTRENECTEELPEIVSTMALLINAGMQLKSAWSTVATGKEGTIYELMRGACDDMKNGMSEIEAINKFGRLSNSAEIRKFTSALTQSIERGGSELSEFLSKQSVEIWALKKQSALQKGEAASSKMLIPTVLLFVGIIIAVFAGAIGMLL